MDPTLSDNWGHITCMQQVSRMHHFRALLSLSQFRSCNLSVHPMAASVVVVWCGCVVDCGGAPVAEFPIFRLCWWYTCLSLSISFFNASWWAAIFTYIFTKEKVWWTLLIKKSKVTNFYQISSLRWYRRFDWRKVISSNPTWWKIEEYCPSYIWLIWSMTHQLSKIPMKFHGNFRCFTRISNGIQCLLGDGNILASLIIEFMHEILIWRTNHD